MSIRTELETAIHCIAQARDALGRACVRATPDQLEEIEHLISHAFDGLYEAEGYINTAKDRAE